MADKRPTHDHVIPSQSGERVESLDAFRGLAVLLCILPGLLLPLLSADSSIPLANGLTEQLSRSVWNGLTLRDLVFPFFLIIMGASIPLSQSRRRNTGECNRRILAHIALRSVFLFVLGVLLEARWPVDFNDIRIAGPFQRIAVCYSCGAIVHLYAGPKARIVMILLMLLEPWAISETFAAPGFRPGDYTMEGNLAAYIDRLYLPGRKYFGIWDPDGILTTIPAIAMTMIGSLLGNWLALDAVRRKQTAWIPFSAGIAAINIGYFWDQWLPINSYLWTGSFVSITSGTFAVAIVGLTVLSDRMPIAIRAVPLHVLGRNALILVAAATLSNRIVPLVMPNLPPLIASLALVVAIGLLAQVLCRRNIFITI